MLKTISFAGAAVALALSSAPSSAKELKSIGISLGLAGQPVFRRSVEGRRVRGQKDQSQCEDHDGRL